MDRSYIACNNSSSGELRGTVTTPRFMRGNLRRMAKRVGDKNDKVTHFLRSWRKGRHLTLEQLAELADTTKATISRTENGKQALTDPALKLYAEKLGTHPSVILSRPPTAEEAPPSKPKVRKLPARGPKRGRA